MRKRAGFTLVELLVSIILMVILLSAVTLIFVRTTETVAISQARTTVYTNARYALDILENDLLGCQAFSSGMQKFIMENGRTNPAPGASPVVATNPTASSSFHTSGPSGAAGDFLLFRATTAIGNTVQTAEISYHLMPGGKTLPSPAGTSVLPTSLTALPSFSPGDSTRGGTVRPPFRPLYTLVRRTRVPDPSTGAWSAFPLDAINAPIPDMELAYFVISFNIEFLANNMSFSQLDTPIPGGSPCPPSDPLGDGAGANDSAPTPLRITFVRVTLVIVEDVGARQERQIQKTIQIPMG